MVGFTSDGIFFFARQGFATFMHMPILRKSVVSVAWIYNRFARRRRTYGFIPLVKNLTTSSRPLLNVLYPIVMLPVEAHNGLWYPGNIFLATSGLGGPGYRHLRPSDCLKDRYSITPCALETRIGYSGRRDVWFC